ncbi:uncharacterized protein BO88DRAFT_43867 [Aspergillus vadensis CBS 113365]|uniref:Uncharacterized protein n=1 Tax=Aspergillus vadensis (strain CBS 113365 / IMI 142717 / IBT 24658) TaxID=1448311 RepID=A0A319BB67_ASPVC|nr:hypothetical protein BO88DRAFT_43867 [Aspergillus vadensis CBS 113365]PYH69201.1 hypothetical protein BO88DRAFT_43867 [Aspergillus vadensis CBS 113365]
MMAFYPKSVSLVSSAQLLVVLRSPSRPQSLPARRLPCVTSFAFQSPSIIRAPLIVTTPWPRLRLHPAGQLSLQIFFCFVFCFVFVTACLAWPLIRVWSDCQLRRGQKEVCRFYGRSLLKLAWDQLVEVVVVVVVVVSGSGGSSNKCHCLNSGSQVSQSVARLTRMQPCPGCPLVTQPKKNLHFPLV